MEGKERYDVKRFSYSLNVKLTDNYEPDWRYIIFDDVNDAELDKLETVCNLLNQQDKELSKLRASYQQVKEENQQLKQELHDLPKKIVEDFYDEIRHRAILEDDYCPDHNLERKYGVRKCLLENIRTTILKKYGGKDG